MAARPRAAPRALLALALLLAGPLGCAAPMTRAVLEAPGGLAPTAEVAGVPFFAAERDHCGPAALATVLGWAGAPAAPGELAPEVFTPGREGTLAHDLLAEARRRGLIAVPVTGLRGLLAELAAGNPVLVLQNLALEALPLWHYAVAVGYDLAGRTITLRSGRIARHATALDTFERTWARAGGWAVVVSPPGRLPAGAGEAALVRAAAGIERAGRPRAAALAYRAVLARWPGSVPARLGLGNALYGAGDGPGAAAAFRAVIAREPGRADAWNNLAQVLGEAGRLAEAREAAARAVALGGPRGAIYRATLRDIEAEAASALVRAGPGL